MKYLVSMLAVLVIACGVAAPVSMGAVGFEADATQTSEPKAAAPIVHDDVGMVIADVLTVRVCPAQECQVAYKDGAEWYLYKGDAVMGACYYFSDGSIWLGFDGRFAAVVFDGERFIENVCR